MLSDSYIIAALTPPEINQKFEQMKKRFGLFLEESDQAELVTLKNLAHITLKSSFSTTDSQELLVSKLTSFHFSPVSILVQDYTIFETKAHGNVLVTLPKPTPKLQTLHESIISAVESNAVNEYARTFEKNHFTPHLSVLYHLPDLKKQEAIEYMKKHILPFEFTLDSFSLFKQSPEDSPYRRLVTNFTA